MRERANDPAVCRVEQFPDFAGLSIVSSASAGAPRLLCDIPVCDIDQPLANTVDRLNDCRPHLLTGYATGLQIRAGRQRAVALRISPEVLHSSGEPLAPQDRALLDRGFGSPCFNVDASTEHMPLRTRAVTRRPRRVRAAREPQPRAPPARRRYPG